MAAQILAGHLMWIGEKEVPHIYVKWRSSHEHLYHRNVPLWILSTMDTQAKCVFLTD